MTENLFWVDGYWTDAKAQTDIDRAVWEALTNIEKRSDPDGDTMTLIETEMRRAIKAALRASKHRDEVTA